MKNLTATQLQTTGFDVNENILQSILESFSEAVFLLDAQCRIVFLNCSAIQTALAAYGVHLRAGCHMVYDFPEHRWEDLKMIFNLVLEGETVQYEIKAKDSGVWMGCHYSPIRDGSGKVTGICARVKDLTIQKKLEEAERKQKELERLSRENQLLFEQFMKHSPLVGWITDEKGLMRYMNPIYQQTYGFSEADFGKSLYDIFPNQLAVDYHLNNLQVLKEGKPIEIVERAVLPGGKEQILKIYKFPLQINGVKMIAGWAVDLSELISLQRELENSVERYHYVNEATSDAIYDWDVVNNRIYRGSGFETIFGYTEKEISFDFRLSRIHPDDLETYKAVVFTTLHDISTNRWNIEYRFKDATGYYRDVIDRAFVLNYDGKAVRVIGAMQDITQQKELQKKLLQKEKRNKRAVVRSIIEAQEKERRKLSLDLHDNVNQMLASCKLMMEVACDGGTNAHHLTKRCYESLNQIITEIRRISHDLNPSVLQDIGLVDSVKQMIEAINGTGKLQIRFVQDGCESKDCLAEADRIAIYRIIQEQISNILKHAKASKATIKLTKKENTVSIIIKDNGIGFDVEGAKKGLGMRNIQNRVDYYCGSMKVFSAREKGTKVEIELTIK